MTFGDFIVSKQVGFQAFFMQRLWDSSVDSCIFSLVVLHQTYEKGFSVSSMASLIFYEKWIHGLHSLAAELELLQIFVHFYRNIFSHVPSTKVKQAALMLKAIHAQESLGAATEKAAQVIASLKAMKLAKAAELVSMHIHETLTYYRYPQPIGHASAPTTPWSGSCVRYAVAPVLVGAFGR